MKYSTDITKIYTFMKREYLKEIVFFFFYGFVKYLPTPIGEILRFLVLKCFLKEIRTVWVKDGVTFWFPGNIRIGRNVSLNEFCVLNGSAPIVIGNHVLIGHQTSIITDDHGTDDIECPIWDQEKRALPITIEDNVYLGCRVIVLKGVTIHSGSVVAAGSVVTRDVPTDSIVAGVPAEVVGHRGKGE